MTDIPLRASAAALCFPQIINTHTVCHRLFLDPEVGFEIRLWHKGFLAGSHRRNTTPSVTLDTLGPRGQSSLALPEEEQAIISLL